MKLIRFHLLAVLAAGVLALAGRPALAADGKPEGQRDLNTVLVEQRLRRLTTELALSDEQKEKLRVLILDEIKYFHSLRENQTLAEEEKTKKEKEYRENSKPKFKAALSEEQYAKWEKLVNTRKPSKPKQP